MTTMLLQATAEVPDYAKFKAAVEWLVADLDHPEGFISMQVLQAADNPNRVMFLEHWVSRDHFERAIVSYDQQQRQEFLTRAGIDPTTFPRELWLESDIPALRA